MVVIEGPRFSTRAESRHYAAQGWSLINMTGHPEAALARELRQCYTAVALVTDMDAGVEAGSGVGQEEVFALFARNIDRLKGLLTTVIGQLPDPDGCTCSTWADGHRPDLRDPGRLTADLSLPVVENPPTRHFLSRAGRFRRHAAHPCASRTRVRARLCAQVTRTSTFSPGSGTGPVLSVLPSSV